MAASGTGRTQRGSGGTARATGSESSRRKGLTPRQRTILEVIQRAVAAHGYPPSMREIGDLVGLKSLSSVTHQLNQLERQGYLRRDPKRPRALEVLVPLHLLGDPEAEAASAVAEVIDLTAHDPQSLRRITDAARDRVADLHDSRRQARALADLIDRPADDVDQPVEELEVAS